MKHTIAILAITLIMNQAACTVVYNDKGNKLLATGANMKRCRITQGRGTTKIDIEEHDAAIIHKEVGNTIIKTAPIVAPFLAP